jgi:hypothetical protein
MSLRFGKLPPKIDNRTLELGKYLGTQLATPPVSFDVLEKISKRFDNIDVTGWFPMDGNDKLKNCTVVAVAHAITIFRGLTGVRYIAPEKAVIDLYYSLTNGVNSDLTMLDVLKHWRKQAVFGDKIFAYTKIDARNHTHVAQAIQLFGCIYAGFKVSANTIKEFQAQETWTPERLTQEGSNGEGHAVIVTAYDPRVLTILTWGSVQKATWEWWDEHVDEVYVTLPPEAKETNFSQGFNFVQLEKDLELIGLQS